MKIIVCGAGKVGRSIVSYLMLGNNDIVVIDNDNNNLSSLAKEFDIQPILGKASHPEVLEKAGASIIFESMPQCAEMLPQLILRMFSLSIS